MGLVFTLAVAFLSVQGNGGFIGNFLGVSVPGITGVIPRLPFIHCGLWSCVFGLYLVAIASLLIVWFIISSHSAVLSSR